MERIISEYAGLTRFHRVKYTHPGHPFSFLFHERRVQLAATNLLAISIYRNGLAQQASMPAYDMPRAAVIALGMES